MHEPLTSKKNIIMLSPVSKLSYKAMGHQRYDSWTDESQRVQTSLCGICTSSVLTGKLTAVKLETEAGTIGGAWNAWIGSIYRTSGYILSLTCRHKNGWKMHQWYYFFPGLNESEVGKCKPTHLFTFAHHKLVWAFRSGRPEKLTDAFRVSLKL